MGNAKVLFTLFCCLRMLWGCAAGFSLCTAPPAYYSCDWDMDVHAQVAPATSLAHSPPKQPCKHGKQKAQAQTYRQMKAQQRQAAKLAGPDSEGYSETLWYTSKPAKNVSE